MGKIGGLRTVYIYMYKYIYVYMHMFILTHIFEYVCLSIHIDVYDIYRSISICKLIYVYLF
jgi:hypothetical protein